MCGRRWSPPVPGAPCVPGPGLLTIDTTSALTAARDPASLRVVFVDDEPANCELGACRGFFRPIAFELHLRDS
jgi:hypothetical protein